MTFISKLLLRRLVDCRHTARLVDYSNNIQDFIEDCNTDQRSNIRTNRVLILNDIVYLEWKL